MKLDNWALIRDDNNPYLAPELRPMVLNGIVDEHPRLGRGANVITSAPVRVEGRTVTTASGTVYELESPSPDFVRVLERAGIGNLDPEAVLGDYARRGHFPFLRQ